MSGLPTAPRGKSFSLRHTDTIHVGGI